jgi:transcriptional regulator with XRE-family HTH domain
VTSTAEAIGERIGYHRRRLGLSQVELAGLIGRSDSWVSQVERGVRSVDRLSVLQKVADVLGVSVAELRTGESPDTEAPADRPEAFESLRLTLTGHPAAGVVLGAPPPALTEQAVAGLRTAHDQVWELVHGSRYNELAPLLAELIPSLERAVRSDAPPDQARAVRQLLTDTYQAVAAMLAKTGEGDAAWVAADRAAIAAESLGDPLALAASLFRMAHVFLSLGQLSQVQAVAVTSAEALESQEATPEVLSLRGAFQLVLAVAAARDNDRAGAYGHLDQARELAAQTGADRNDFGTEFGPTNVALHSVAVAVELGDAGQALDLAGAIDPAGLSPERQARYSLDLAQAHAMRRQAGEALHYLELAEQLTPEQTRSHRVAQAVARDLLHLAGPRVRPELRELADRFGVTP